MESKANEKDESKEGQEFRAKVLKQEKIASAVKVPLIKFFNQKAISKEEYKWILGKCVFKIYRSKSPLDEKRVKYLVSRYVMRARFLREQKRRAIEQSKESIPP
jgi:hypothetical protein